MTARLGRFAVALLVLAVLPACGTAAGSNAQQASTCKGPATAAAATDITPVTPSPVPHLPVRYRDVTGTTITVKDTSRILALDTYGTLGTTVYALGLGDKMVGRDISTGVPELAKLPVVTHDGHQLSAEAILALNPSVILTDYTIGPLEVQLQLRDAGVPVVIMSDERTRDSIAPRIRDVAKVLGVPAAGEQVVENFEQQLAAARAEVATVAPPAGKRLRMVFLYVRGNAGVYYWFGDGSGADDLITELQGVDVASEVGVKGERPLTAEGLVKAAPDLALMMTDGLKSVGGVEGLRKVPGVAETNAGANDCIVDMADTQILNFGPQFPATLTALTHAIYGPAK